jgi:quercetin dioxygenase-like cupin family protein
MQVIRKGQNPEEDRSNAPIFYGGKVTGQPIVGGGMSKNFNFNLVNFAAGAKNKFHSHTSDQILFVTSGTGYVATEKEQVEIAAGDTALIPAGEKHWHGATDHSDFSHISLTAPDSKTTIYD